MAVSLERTQLEQSELIIRTATAGDRDALRKLCVDTAYFGEPCEAFFPDREFLADLIMEYYIRYEPHHTWVAQYQGEIIAYLSAGFAEAGYTRIMLKKILPGAMLRALGRGRIWDRRTVKLIGYNFMSFISGQTRLPASDQATYPVHIHQNTRQGFRGKGIGRKLLEAFLDTVKKEQALGVRFRALRGEPRFPFFDTYGFKCLACRRVKYWERWLKKSPLYFMEYGKIFDNTQRAR